MIAHTGTTVQGEHCSHYALMDNNNIIITKRTTLAKGVLSMFLDFVALGLPIIYFQ